MLYSFDTAEQLIGVAFLDTNLYINSLTSVKSFLIVGDIKKSIWLVGYQEEPSKLVMLSKDFSHCTVVDSCFLLDENSLGFAVSDMDGNLQVLNYSPQRIAII
jgi:cleavage and polyadenylation specificity factor subunit 1